MSSLWTPDGERQVSRSPKPDPTISAVSNSPRENQPSAEELAEMESELRAMSEEIVSVPAAAIIANHAVGLFQLAAAHLQTVPPNLDDARLAVDAMASLVDGLKGRLSDEETLVDALAQIRLAYVQVAAAARE